MTVLKAPMWHRKLVRSHRKSRIVPVPVEKIGKKHAAEEHDLRQQEEPHAKATGLALLVFRLKVMPVLRENHMLIVNMWFLQHRMQ